MFIKIKIKERTMKKMRREKYNGHALARCYIIIKFNKFIYNKLIPFNKNGQNYKI